MIFGTLCLLMSSCCFGETRTVIKSKDVNEPKEIEDKHYKEQIENLLKILKQKELGNDEKYSILNSSLVFKDFLSNKNITIKNLDDLVKHYIKSDQRGQVVINGGYYTWKIYSASRRLGDLEVWMIMNTAFEIWSTISRNRFIYSPESVRTDFNIGFVTYNHYTSAGYECTPFNDRVLGHAYYPDTHYAGEIHFNDVQVFQRWKGEVSYSLLHVAIHEIGHALGLRHNNRRTSIMFPQEVYNKHLYLNLNFFDRIDRSYFL